VVLLAEDHAAQAAVGRVVVQRDPGIVEKARQPRTGVKYVNAVSPTHLKRT